MEINTNKLRLDLENLILLIDRESPNKRMALEILKEWLKKLGGVYRG